MTDEWRERYLLHARLSSHRRRVDEARAALRAAAAIGPVIVSTSWGKDSIALADIALDTLGPLPLMHVASAYELPGAEHVVEHFRALASAVHTIGPTRTLPEVIAWLAEIGLDHTRSGAAKDAGKRAKTSTAQSAVDALGYRVQALGLRAEEARHRAARTAVYGLVHTRKDGVTICTPIARWSAVDVWAWIAARDLPYPRCYDCESHDLTRETIRNSGWLTTTGAERGRIAWLRRWFPAEWRQLCDAFPEARLHA